METIERAVIMAAGMGNRLRPVTEETPKPLVRVNGTRLIDTSITAMKKNGIRDIYIVAGYKIEKFHEAFDSDPMIHILENTNYLKGNNITSLYAARDYLPGAFVAEGDLLVRDEKLFDPAVEGSAYCAVYMKDCPEWAMKVKDGRIISCEIAGGTDAYRNIGISVWTRKDGEKLAELITEQMEVKKDWSIYWDEIPLMNCHDQFSVGIRQVEAKAVTEIDTLDELIAMDPSYEIYRR